MPINDLLLAALLQTFTEWTGETVLQLIVTAHGRDPLFDDMDVSRTVGWLSVHCPVLLERGAATTPGELLRTVQEQLRRIPHRGIGYDLLRYYSDDPAIRAKLQAQPPVEVIFNYEGQYGQAGGESAPFRLARESAGSVVTPRQGRPRVLHINSHIAGGRLRFEWGYSRNLHRRATVERLARRHLDVIRSMIETIEG
jgi:non-ribosomal peptide synthase protein (TIGR01720 family)